MLGPFHDLVESERVHEFEKGGDHRPDRRLSPQGLGGERRAEDDVLRHLAQHGVQVLPLHRGGKGVNMRQVHRNDLP